MRGCSARWCSSPRPRRSGTSQSILSPANTVPTPGAGPRCGTAVSQHPEGRCRLWEPSLEQLPGKKAPPPPPRHLRGGRNAAGCRGGNNPALCGSCREKKPPQNAGEVRQPQAAFCPAGRVLGGGTQTAGPLRCESGQESPLPAARADGGVAGVGGGGTQPPLFAPRHNLPRCCLSSPRGGGSAAAAAPSRAPRRLQPFPLTPPALKGRGRSLPNASPSLPRYHFPHGSLPAFSFPGTVNNRELFEIKPFCCLFLHPPKFQCTLIVCQLIP